MAERATESVKLTAVAKADLETLRRRAQARTDAEATRSQIISAAIETAGKHPVDFDTALVVIIAEAGRSHDGTGSG